MDIEKIFKDLNEFKGLPTYQFERRIDAFILSYLEPAFNEIYGVNDYKFIYPEFPLWPTEKNNLKLNKSASRSIYADYVMWSKKMNNTIYLIEFKTDNSSVHQAQFDNYILNCKYGWGNLMNDFLKKAIHAIENGGPWRKYCYGLDFLYDKESEITGVDLPFNLHKFYLQKRGVGVKKCLKNFKLKFKINYNLKLVYLAPKDALKYIQMGAKDTIDFFDKLISLTQFADFTKEPLKTLLRKIDKE